MSNRPLTAPRASKLPSEFSAGWNSLTFPAENGVELLYQLYIPQNFDMAKRYPLILYMHSAGVRCDDNSHIYTGEAKFLRNLEANAYRDGVLVLAPCCPRPEKWVDVDRWGAWYRAFAMLTRHAEDYGSVKPVIIAGLIGLLLLAVMLRRFWPVVAWAVSVLF